MIGVAVIAVWLGYAGIMGYSGIVGDPTRMPPGIFLLLTPIIAFVGNRAGTLRRWEGILPPVYRLA